MTKKAVILCGGLGIRLAPLTSVFPKPLLPIGEKAMIEIQIEQLKKYGFTEIYLATNYKSEYFERFFGNGDYYGVNIIISKETKPLGTAGPIKLLEDKLDEPFLVMNGDIITQLNFDKIYQYAIEKKGLLTAGVKKMIMPYDFGNIHFDGDAITKIEEKPNIIMHGLAGIYAMHPDIMEYIPSDTYFGMDSLLEVMIQRQEKIYKYDIEDYWLDVGRMDDYNKIRNSYDEMIMKEKESCAE
ncbi:Nucleotidyl transferase [Paenibacillus curdlanolyticus YK9]|uniref:Nucleotidyl transferase n=1 Tax=Paenibacillus curdlanolyticus YK9 TaxID=717606 RepID=E0I8C5_9BACL|nr:sugar phosphate nucleotidyltransferase [Paenibacillus curdlanolyticus]EFM11430.1 Nucleotidyl transferase [Paenibacillus curdlanolyticus YK9]